MSTRHADEEFREIQTIQRLVRSIPRYRDYFMVEDVSVCTPAPLTEADFQQFDTRCHALTKKSWTPEAVNRSLDELRVLQLPDGGVDVDEYARDHPAGGSLRALNRSLIDLLLRGILPMNQRRVFHCDIKDSNVLVQQQGQQWQQGQPGEYGEDLDTDTDLDTLSESPLATLSRPSPSAEPALRSRLIDWGLSFHLTPAIVRSKQVPAVAYRRPFQYNVPFSSILFSKEFVQRYDAFLRKAGPASAEPMGKEAMPANKQQRQAVEPFQVREMVTDYIFFWNKERGPGHLQVLHEIVGYLTADQLPSVGNKQVRQHVLEYGFTYYYIVEYLTAVLLAFTRGGRLHLMEYFHEVFVRNVDVWGFVMIYVSIYEGLRENHPNRAAIKEAMRRLVLQHLFGSAAAPIPIPALVRELRALDQWF